MQAFNDILRNYKAVGLLWALSIGLSAPAYAGTNYTVVNLGSLSGGYSQADAVNSSGEVAGYSATVAGFDDAVSWTTGTLTDLGTLPSGQFSYAYGIADSGQIVGTGSDSSGNYHALLWLNGQAQDIGTLGSDPNAAAMAINSAGEIAGFAMDSTNAYHAVVWMPQSGGGYQVEELGTFSGSQAQATAINSAGAVAGYYTDSAGNSHACLWQNGAQEDIGDLGGGQSFAEGINSAGDVVGQALTAGGAWHAFLWQNGQMTDLGTLGGPSSVAYAVSDSDQIVGEADDANGNAHAALWNSGVLVDLGVYVGDESYAYAVSDSGQIAGEASSSGAPNAFLLSPVAQSTTPPATTASLSGPAGNDGWYTGAVTVTLTATDPGGAGVAANYYTVDGGAQETYSSPFTVSGDGIHTVTYGSVDTSGNAETMHSLTIQIDGAPPVTTAAVSGTLGKNGWYISPVTVTLSASDATSGVARVMVARDCNKPRRYTGPISVGNGTHTLTYYSTDVAGNSEAPQKLTLKVDIDALRLNGRGRVSSLGKGAFLILVEGSCYDPLAGVSTSSPTWMLSDDSGPVEVPAMKQWIGPRRFLIETTVQVPKGKNGGYSDKFTIVLGAQSNAGSTASVTLHLST